MGNEEPSGQQAVDIEAALRWADRHEARERQKLRDMGLPPEGDMPVTGAFFVRGLVAMLRTAAPTAPGTADAVSVPRAMLAPFITEASNWADSVPDDYRAPCAEPGKTHVYPGSETAYTVGDLRRLAAHCSAAPSTAAGEPALVCGCGWEGSYADLNETAEGMTCPKCRLSRNMDCAATPPAQGVEEETETLENLIDAAIGAHPAPPWQEQAAQIRRDALEEAAKICDEMYVTFSSSMSPDRKNNKSWAMAANALADKIRALVRSEKGEGK